MATSSFPPTARPSPCAAGSRATALLIVALDGRGAAPQVHGIGLPLDEDYAAFVAEARERRRRRPSAKLKGKRDRERTIEAARLAARRAAQRW